MTRSSRPARPGGRLRESARFFFLGLLSLSLQTLLLREAHFAFHGGEIGLGLFFAVWLGAIAIGARAAAAWVAPGGVVASPARGDRLFRAGMAWMPWCGIVQVALFRLHRLVVPVPAGGYLPAALYLLLLLVAVAPAGFLTGLLFPLGLRAGRASPGRAYALEALGSMAGGAFVSLYALGRLPPVSLLAGLGVLGGVLVGAPGWVRSPRLAGRARGVRGRAAGVGVLLFSTLGLLLFWVSGGGAWVEARTLEARWDGLATGTRAVRSFETPYHQVTVGRLQGEASLYIDGLYQGALADPYVDSLAAARLAIQHPAPRRVLLLAPGLYGAARVLAAAPGVDLTLVRPDPALDELEGEGVGGRAGPRAPPLRVRRLTADPRQAVRALRTTERPGRSGVATSGGERFDLILVASGAPRGGASNRLFTREFFADAARLLAPGGVLALRIPGAANVASPEVALLRGSIVAALKAVFTEVRIAPGIEHELYAWGPRLPGPGAGGGPGTTRVQVDLGASPLTWDPDSLAARRARLWPGEPRWPAALFAAQFPPERTAALAERVGGEAARAEPNRDARPFVFYEELRRWDRVSGSHLGGLLTSWHAHPWRWSLVTLALLVLLMLALRRRHGPALASLAGTGWAGMSADLLLLYLYQTSQGTLYLRVGLIVGLYMGGLALGAALGGASRAWARRRAAIAWSDLVWVAFLLLGIPASGVLGGLAPSGREAALLATALLAGSLTALPFPWVADRLAAAGRGRAAGGGLADAADHLGALGGALLTGVLLVPLLGFPGTLLLLAGLKLGNAAGWLGGSRRWVGGRS